MLMFETDSALKNINLFETTCFEKNKKFYTIHDAGYKHKTCNKISLINMSKISESFLQYQNKHFIISLMSVAYEGVSPCLSTLACHKVLDLIVG